MNDYFDIKKLLQISSSYDIQKSDRNDYENTHTPFVGTPKKHPSDENILILLTSPFTDDKKFYEFPVNSIGIIEDMGTITSTNGESANKIKVWIKKGMPGLIAEPFIVE